MENYHLTKEQQLQQETNSVNIGIDGYFAKLDKLKEDNKILLTTMKEIAVKYPDDMNPEQAETLCKYLIARAQEAIAKTETL